MQISFISLRKQYNFNQWISLKKKSRTDIKSQFLGKNKINTSLIKKREINLIDKITSENERLIYFIFLTIIKYYYHVMIINLKIFNE